MPKESTLSKDSRLALRKARFQVCRVENPCEPGFPDLAFETPEGFIGLCELKQMPAPKRASTVIELELLTSQRAFIQTWGKGAVFTFARVGNYFLLLRDGRLALNLKDMLETALWYGNTKTALKEEFPSALRRESARVYIDAVRACDSAP